MGEQQDAVDHFIDRWAHVRPDVDVTPMAVIGRLSRLASLVQRQLNSVFGAYGLQSWEFDVLATLRRAGAGVSLTPGQLDRTMMISSGTTTHRLKRLEDRGWVLRERDSEDGRSIRVQLTEEGLKVCDRVQEAHMDNERAILAGLTSEQQVQLAALLRSFALSLGDRSPDAK